MAEEIEHEVDYDRVAASPMQAVEGAPEERSLLDTLRAAKEEAEAQETVDIKLPGFEKSSIRLYARYRMLEGKEIDERGRKIRREFKKEFDRQLYGSIDLMIAACEGIFYRTDEDDEPQQLTIGGSPVTGYTPALAEAFGVAIDDRHPARSIVLGMFNNNDVAIGAHNLRLSLWMADTSTDVDQALLGNP